MRSKEIRVFVGGDMHNLMVKECFKDKYHIRSMSSLVREALDLYFQRGIEVPVISSIKEQKPLSNPEIIQKKQEPDPDIKSVFSVSGGIKPGPGVHQRLEAIGIKSIDVVRARRAMRTGLEYNKDLEKYFDIV
jgi:hypothetical protein